jgi:hypothetical protein
MKHLKVFAYFAFSALLMSCAQAQQQPINIALGKAATFSAPPNYPLGAKDATPLTDGKYSSLGDGKEASSVMWKQKSTLGWRFVGRTTITIDLGSVQSISGVSYSTVAGRDWVEWPQSIYIATSDDNKIWHYAGDLVQLSQKNNTKGYAKFIYETNNLHTKGRYIAFGIVARPYIFVDEIQVYKGDDAWLTQPASGRVISSMDDMTKEAVYKNGIQKRLNNDIAAIRKEVAESHISPQHKSTFMAELDKNADAALNMTPPPLDLKAILPINDIHRDILAVHGELLAAEGEKLLTAWHQPRYAWLPFLAKPNDIEKATLDFSMLRNQFRSDNLLLTNASGETQKVLLQLKNPPQGVHNGWLQVDSVAWTDTLQGVPVADALLPVQLQNGSYQIDVPAGMTRKVWFTIDSSKVPAHVYKSTFVISGAGQQITVPLQISVSKIAMGTPRFSLGMWDYTNVKKGKLGITPENRESAIKLMRSHYVDSPWAVGVSLSAPFEQFDQWVAMWPGARHYFVAAAVGDSYGISKIGTPEFDTKVGVWAKELSAHLKELGLEPRQLGINLRDEPHDDKSDAIVAAWAKAINTAAPELTIFENPIWERPDQTKIQDAITQADILCLNFPIFKKGGAPVEKYFENLRDQGKKIWFYQVNNVVRLIDPQEYYRFQPWQAFAIGGTGEGYWSFGDTAGASSSWNEYDNGISGYTPVFIDKNTVTNSVHWDAVREGIEDYEELAMLQDRIKTSNDGAWKSRAQDVLSNAVAAITGSWTGNYNWQDAKDPIMADEQLQLVQKMLQKK